MSQKKTGGLKQNIRDRIVTVETERDSALTRLRMAERELGIARAESRRLRDLCRWNQGVQNRRFVTV